MIQEFENNIVVFFNTVPDYVGKGIIDLIAAIVGGVFIAWLTSTLFAKKSQIAETEGEILKKKVSIYEELAAKLEDLRNLNTIDENMRKAFMKVLKDASLETSNLSHRYVITIFSDPKTFTSTFLDLDKYITSHRIFYDDEVLKSAMILQNYLGAIRRIQSLYEQNIQSLKVSLDEPKSYKFETALMTELGILVEQEFSQLIDKVLESIRNSLDNLRLSHHKTIPHTAEFYGENGPILGALKDTIIIKDSKQITQLIESNLFLAMIALGKIS